MIIAFSLGLLLGALLGAVLMSLIHVGRDFYDNDGEF